MPFVLTAKELWGRRLWVLPGLVLAAAVALAAAFQLPSLKARQKTVWTANAQVLVDTHSSAIGDLNEGLGVLIPRASVYANLMTSQSLVKLIAKQAAIPSSQITVAGPIGTNGTRTVRGAPSGVTSYSLQLDTDITQPTIRISATAPSAKAAAALANGSGAALNSYVTHLENAQQVTKKRRADIRQLGAATETRAQTGAAPILVVPIFLAIALLWCLLVLFVTRFVAAWRHAPGLPPPDDVSTDIEPDGTAPAVDEEADSADTDDAPVHDQAFDDTPDHKEAVPDHDEEYELVHFEAEPPKRAPTGGTRAAAYDRRRRRPRGRETKPGPSA